MGSAGDVDPDPWKLTVDARDDRAGRVVALVVGSRLPVFLSHEPGVRADVAEDLHQFRVELRRTRSVLSSFAGVLPDDRRRAAISAMRAMAEPTSPVRDLDVLEESLEALVGDVLTDDVLRISALLESRRRDARAQVLEAMDGRPHAQLVEAWRNVSEVYIIGGGARPQDANALMGGVADRALWRAYRHSRKVGRKAARSDDLEHWHDLRKALKGFRYLLEAFAPLWSSGPRRGVRRHLRELQDHIGGLQDLRIQAQVFGDLAQDAGSFGWPGTSSLAVEVSRRLRDEAETTRLGCRQAWSLFDTSETRSQMRELTGRAS